MFEPTLGHISIAAAGDIILSRPISIFTEPRFLALVDILRGSDALYINLEQVIRKNEGSPQQHEAHLSAPPSILEELMWMGVDIVSCANNHAYNYGEGGILSTIEYLEAAGMAHAGSGRHLAAARAPGYLETPKGRVALLSAATPEGTAGRAGDQRPDCEGRPGISMLRPQYSYHVDKQALSELQRISRLLGFEAQKEETKRQMGTFMQESEADPQKALTFLQANFVESDAFGIRSAPAEDDASDILRWVREARRAADWVMLSIHSHEVGATRDGPPEFLVTFAHAAIDAGVDVFVAHGPHLLRGIEIYRSRPIYYGLGNFILQWETNAGLPADVYSLLGLGYDHTPADVQEARSGGDIRGTLKDTAFWESVVVVNKFEGHKLAEVELHPVVLGYMEPLTCRGRPMLADREQGERILGRLSALSQPFGTRIDITDREGVIRLA